MIHTSRILQGFCLLAVGVLVGRWTSTIDTVSAQVPSKKGPRELLIGNVPIHLGDPEESTLKALREQYEVTGDSKMTYQGNQAEFFTVTTSKAALSPSLGNLTVQQGRVVDATRYWEHIDAPQQEIVSFFQQVYGALESASAERQTSIVLCGTSRKPDAVIATVVFDFGGRTASLNLLRRESKRLSEMTVEEGLSSIGGH